MKKIEPPEKELFIKTYSENNIHKTASIFGVSPNTIKRWCKDFGFVKLQAFNPDVDEFTAFYKEHNTHQTAERYGVSIATISNWVKLLGIQKRRPHDRKKKPTKEQLREYLVLHTNKEATVHFKLGLTTIDRLIKRYGLTDMDKELVIEPYNKLAVPNKDDFEKVYLSRPIEEAAAYFGVGPWIVGKWREQLGIKCKTERDLPNAFTPKQLELIIGSLLGDGCLRKVETPDENSYYTEQHGPDQYGYLHYKYKELQPFSSSLKPKSNYKVLQPAKNGMPYKVDYNQIRTSFIFDTYASPLFTALEKKWYKRDTSGEYEYIQRGKTWCRVKQLPDDLNLTPFIVAIWYYDDGSSNWRNDKDHHKGKCRRSRRICLCTQSFSKEECERLTDLLKGLGITHCNVTTNGEIVVTSKSFVDFTDMVKTYLPHPCLKYKVEYEPPTGPIASNTSGYTGVYKRNRGNKWESYITVDGKRKYLGVFDTPETASIARLKHLQELQ